MVVRLLFAVSIVCCCSIRNEVLCVESSGALCRSCNAYRVNHLLALSIYMHVHCTFHLYILPIVEYYLLAVSMSFYLYLSLFIAHFFSLSFARCTPIEPVITPIQVSSHWDLSLCMDERVWFMYYVCWYWCICVYAIHRSWMLFVYKQRNTHGALSHLFQKVNREYLSSLFLCVTWFVLSHFVVPVWLCRWCCCCYCCCCRCARHKIFGLTFLHSWFKVCSVRLVCVCACSMHPFYQIHREARAVETKIHIKYER